MPEDKLNQLQAVTKPALRQQFQFLSGIHLHDFKSETIITLVKIFQVRDYHHSDGNISSQRLSSLMEIFHRSNESLSMMTLLIA